MHCEDWRVILVQNSTNIPECASEVSGENSCEILSLKIWNKHTLAQVPFRGFFRLMVQPIADRVVQNLEIISKNLQFSTRRSRILMGFIIYYLVLIVNFMCRILVRWKRFKNNLEIQCHPICNRLYESYTCANMNMHLEHVRCNSLMCDMTH